MGLAFADGHGFSFIDGENDARRENAAPGPWFRLLREAMERSVNSPVTPPPWARIDAFNTHQFSAPPLLPAPVATSLRMNSPIVFPGADLNTPAYTLTFAPRTAAATRHGMPRGHGFQVPEKDAVRMNAAAEQSAGSASPRSANESCAGCLCLWAFKPSRRTSPRKRGDYAKHLHGSLRTTRIALYAAWHPAAGP